MAVSESTRVSEEEEPIELDRQNSSASKTKARKSYSIEPKVLQNTMSTNGIYLPVMFVSQGAVSKNG